MEDRKMVYWERQNVVEYWTHSKVHGYKEVSKDIGMTWPCSSFKYHNQIASDETFKKREYGLINY